jgi:hypothetical protein
MTALKAQLRAAQADLEKYNREHRPQTVQTTARPTPPLTSTTYSYTPQYRHYTYPYAQYQSNYTYPGFTTGTPSTTQYQYPVVTTGTATSSTPQTTTAQTQTPSTTSTTPASDVLSKPVSLSLPISSLPALHALGIMPVSSLSVPPPGQPQPQAVLKGTTANGTMLTLEVNIGQLQATQVSGLALIINAIAAQAVSATSSQSGASSAGT